MKKTFELSSWNHSLSVCEHFYWFMCPGPGVACVLVESMINTSVGQGCQYLVVTQCQDFWHLVCQKCYFFLHNFLVRLLFCSFLPPYFHQGLILPSIFPLCSSFHCLFSTLLTFASSLYTSSSATSCLFCLIFLRFFFICLLFLHPLLLNQKPQMDSQPQLSGERVGPASPALASTVSVSCLTGLADLHTVQKMPEGRRPDTSTCTYKHEHTHTIIH